MVLFDYTELATVSIASMGPIPKGYRRKYRLKPVCSNFLMFLKHGEIYQFSSYSNILIDNQKTLLLKIICYNCTFLNEKKKSSIFLSMGIRYYLLINSILKQGKDKKKTRMTTSIRSEAHKKIRD